MTAEPVTRRTSEPITMDQVGCARCGGDGHPNTTYMPFTHPIELPDGDRMTHWAMCPTVNEPIMLLIRDSQVLLRHVAP